MRNILILMTALVPTNGHADMIKFAAAIPESKVHVLVNGRTFEPVETSLRVESLKKHFVSFENVYVKGSVEDKAPQNPEDMIEGFWDWWVSEINKNFPQVQGKWNYVVASEPYGLNVANSLGADFLPYDLERVYDKSRGTEVRRNLVSNWESIIQEFRKNLMMKAVLFGQESVGKTTVSKLVAEKLDATWSAEFARPYLESVGSELNLNKMKSILLGQAALQKKVFETSVKPYAVFDTDLFSTVGYYRIMNERVPEECLKFAEKFSSDVYYVLPDTIPFIEDELRYGGDKRETETIFWIKLLEEFDKIFVLVPDGSVNEKADFIVSDMSIRFESKNADIRNFQRD